MKNDPLANGSMNNNTVIFAEKLGAVAGDQM